MRGVVRFLPLFGSIFFPNTTTTPKGGGIITNNTNTTASTIMTKMVQEEEVSFPGFCSHNTDDIFDLAGTLRFPASGENDTVHPAAIIIHGSGPIDRNGNAIMPLLMGSMKLNTHNHLANALAESNNMAVLCYDKRGIGKSTCPTNKDLYYQAGMMDLVHDAVEAYKYLVENSKIDSNQIVLIGHSEGAILLPLIAETIMNTSTLPPPKGLIFLAGFGETLDGAARNQRELILKEVQEESGLQGWILRKVLTREKLESQFEDYMTKVNDTSQEYYKMHCGLVKVPTKWYREHLEWDAAKSLRECPCDILAITGEKDVQVQAKLLETAEELAPKAASLETHVIANMTHILRSTEEKPSLLNIQKLYSKLGKEPLDTELLQIVNDWVKKRLE